MGQPASVMPGVDRRFTAVTAALVAGCGVGVALSPMFLLAVTGVLVILLFVRIPPVPHLVLLLGVTAVVPYGVQNSLGVGGGSGAPGLLLTDLLLISGLVRVAPEVWSMAAGRRVRIGAMLVLAFVGVAALQFVHGVVAGRDPSTAGAEFRAVFGLAAFLLAVPILRHDEDRARLLRALPWLGLVVGLWGMAQWIFGLGFTASGDSGVQEGIRFTSAGRGQLQGGLFAFPVAIVMALAALMSDDLRSVRARLLILAVLVLNAVSLILTYERTFWVATVLAAGFVVVNARGVQRFRAAVGAMAVALLALAALATLAPSELTAARERLLSVSQYASDDSLRFRVTESRHVMAEIGDQPLVGSGFGASVFFGRPWDLVPPESRTFAHNGYLWLAWKVGIPGALLLMAVLILAVGRLERPADGSAFEAVRSGARGALLVLILASVTFPSFSQLGITAVMGVLLAISCSPRLAELSPQAP